MVRIYRQAATRLRSQIRLAIQNDAIGTAAYRERQLEAIQRELRALGQRTRGLTFRVVAEPYIRGALAVDASTDAGATRAAFAFSGTHIREVATIAANVNVRLADAINLVGRRTNDAFRRVALEQIGPGIAAGETRKATSAALEQALIRENVTDAVTGFVDRAGRRWQLDTYARMVARTTTRETMSTGVAKRMGETGQKLITISDHATDTVICQEYEGKTFALPGTIVKGEETIDQLPPFHPNCLHVATPAEANVDAFLAALESMPLSEVDRLLGVA